VPYKIEYSPDVLGHLQALTVRQQRTLLDAVETQLTYEPNVETRNRKQMRPNSLAPWELRVGNLRVVL
jgi:mRNA-degrading endonuclease RelE of RelBE toxin-antitoxin system